MKNILLSILFGLVLSSCVRKVTYEPTEVQDRVIINAQLTSGPGPHTIYAGISKTKTVAKLRGARICCYVNGEYVCEAVCDDTERNTMQTPYVFDTELTPGDRLYLDVTSPIGDVYAETVVPSLNGRITTITAEDKGDEMEFAIEVEDFGVGSNFFMLSCQHRYDRKLIRYISAGNYSYREKNFSERITLSHRDDPILDGAYLGSVNNMNDMLGTGIPNVYCIFSDKKLKDSKGTINVSISKKVLYSTSLDYEVYLEQDYIKTQHWVDFSLSQITKEEFDYLAALSSLKAYNFDSSDLLEEAVVPSNVIGGEGFVSVFTEERKTLSVGDE
ncbi:MAG: DUF4249 family protein [Bacteroidales bacterium]|nr:DUF4249 family protein [Bacteroidales bacterium]